ncbi:MAG: hypothetical protein LBT70_04615 [Holosporaceae bacterium]|nr:hypothetical protein [Holosporaceae bacterium]
MKKKLNVLQKNICFFESGTEAIVAALKAAAKNEKIVAAVPDFFCNRVLLLLRMNNITYRFYSLDEKLCFNENSHRQCLEQECNFFIIPHLFVHKNFDSFVEKIANQKKYCLIDVCQTYDAMFDKNKIIKCDYVSYALSFGHSKPSQSSGGGALIFFGKNFTQNLMNIISGDFFSDFICESKFFQDRYDFLNHEFQQSVLNKFTRKYQMISEKNAAKAYENLSRMIDEKQQEKNYYSLEKCLKNIFGHSSLRYVEMEAIPSIFALHLEGKRYSVGKKLSELGIETTWYYPKNFDAPANSIAENIRKNILILPFSRYHQDVQQLIEALKKYENYYKKNKY